MSQAPESVNESDSRGRSSTVRRGSMGNKRPQLGVREAMVRSSQVIIDKDVQVLVDEGAPSVNEPVEPTTEPTGQCS
ncbi:hypothetical protein L6452_01328 [Arctium lappa]|uniref:Uncharacterized protein n=1 Tax=Arctium lappa TaxID=4217 RepID=A0ACB9FH05_ARCLA|nr:hypothetical protein L6452_01328 [Arctium lappa]